MGVRQERPTISRRSVTGILLGDLDGIDFEEQKRAHEAITAFTPVLAIIFCLQALAASLAFFVLQTLAAGFCAFLIVLAGCVAVWPEISIRGLSIYA